MVQWVKDPVLLELWLGFDSWPGNFHMLQVREKKNYRSFNRFNYRSFNRFVWAENKFIGRMSKLAA